MLHFAHTLRFAHTLCFAYKIGFCKNLDGFRGDGRGVVWIPQSNIRPPVAEMQHCCVLATVLHPCNTVAFIGQCYISALSHTLNGVLPFSFFHTDSTQLSIA